MRLEFNCTGVQASCFCGSCDLYRWDVLREREVLSRAHAISEKYATPVREITCDECSTPLKPEYQRLTTDQAQADLCPPCAAKPIWPARRYTHLQALGIACAVSK